MSNIKIEFPDGSSKEYQSGITGEEVVTTISEGLARNTICYSLNDVLYDLREPIVESGKIKFLTFNDPQGVDVFRHSSAHLMAQAIKRLFPQAKLTIGPVVKDGFYYDVDHPPFKSEDLEKIEAEMKKIVSENLEIKRKEVSIQEAKDLFKDNEYKQELLDELEKDGSQKITIYSQGEFFDLCRGPHVPSTKMIKSFKLTKTSSAYWRGDAKNKSLQRVYGISFPDKKLLKEYLELKAEAERRDHRKIGKRLRLYSFQEEAPGMPFFHDKGTHIWNKLAEFMLQEMLNRDYEINKTPIILNKQLWLQSGHWDHYKENMYFTKIDSDEENYAVKPMNCPGNILIFKDDMHSYKELPIRAGEFGLVHRHELSGTLSGLFRVRCFTQDDAHVFCTREQIKSEIKELIEFVDQIYKTFGFSYKMELSTKPEKATGDEELWALAEQSLQEVLDEGNYVYKLNPGDGAFYGPKIDFHLQDSIGRTWQCGTIQLDFQMPEKFDLTYEGKDGNKHRPVMLHRAIYGSFERFLGMLVEHFAGKFPLWLNPNQIKILSIADRHIDFSIKTKRVLKQKGFRVEVDSRSESINKKVRDAQLEQFNYILVVGDKEVENNTVTIRARNNKIIGTKNVDDFIKDLQIEIDNKVIPEDALIKQLE